MGKGVKKIALVLVAFVAMVAGFGSLQYDDAEAHSGHIIGPTNGARFSWSGSGNLNLSTGAVYACGTGYDCNDWSFAKGNAQLSWDNAPIAVNFPYANPGSSNKVYIIFDHDGCATGPWGGGTFCTSFDSSGHHRVQFFNGYANPVYPGSAVQTVDRALIIIKTSAFSADCESGGVYGPNCRFAKQAVIAHALGHVMALKDLPKNNACGDANYYQSLMDRDCTGEPYFINNGPRNLDFCTVNHVYHDPFRGGLGGYDGCGQP